MPFSDPMISGPMIAVDAGQTAIKVGVGVDGWRTASYPGLRTNTGLIPQLAQVVLDALGGRGDGVTVAVGSTGLTQHDDDPEGLLALVRDAGVSAVLLAHDSVTSFLGALGDRRGVVVAAGTGSIILGVGRANIARVDGWGNLVGDAGSGYWIGRRAIDAALRDYDGRGPATALTDAVRQRFPVLDNLYIELQTDPGYVRVVSGFSRVAAALAGSDAVALSICREAGAQLADSAIAAARRVGEGDDAAPAICLIGGVLRDGPVRAACVERLRGRWPGFSPTEPLGDGLDGARTLVDLPGDHPLAQAVSRARI